MCRTPAAPFPDIEKSLCAPSLAGDLLLLLLAPLGQLCIWFGVSCGCMLPASLQALLLELLRR